MRWFTVFVIAAFLVGCSAAGFSAKGTHFGIRVDVETTGVGKRPLSITINDLQGNPIGDATVMVTPIMPEHGMLGIPQTLIATEKGVYKLAELDLMMSGEWQLQVDIQQNGQRDTLTLPITIQ